MYIVLGRYPLFPKSLVTYLEEEEELVVIVYSGSAFDRVSCEFVLSIVGTGARGTELVPSFFFYKEVIERYT